MVMNDRYFIGTVEEFSEIVAEKAECGNFVDFDVSCEFDPMAAIDCFNRGDDDLFNCSCAWYGVKRVGWFDAESVILIGDYYGGGMFCWTELNQYELDVLEIQETFIKFMHNLLANEFVDDIELFKDYHILVDFKTEKGGEK